MSTATEGKQALSDGFEVYTKTWTPNPPTTPRARILFVHGFSDHCNNYDTLFPWLAEHGISVHAFDQRGWGRSAVEASQKGLSGPTTQVMSDITDMLSTVLPSPNKPVYLMGHSMGGGEVLTYLCTGPSDKLSQVRGIIALAPLITLHPTTRPWNITVIAGRLAGKLLPHFQMVNKLSPDLLSHDKEQNKEWEKDPLNHNTGTLQQLAGMLDRGRFLDDGTYVVQEGRNEGGKTRLLVCHGTEDGINEFVGSERFVQRAEVADKELKTYEGWYHNIHCEVGYERFREELLAWIEKRLDLGNEGVQQAKL